ncbi:MAG: hypothetical protein HY075_10345 [Deltaproteobacteria bacterium]|nr:hypothetical protein [Deltaproteobacteria bacterium]
MFAEFFSGLALVLQLTIAPIHVDTATDLSVELSALLHWTCSNPYWVGSHEVRGGMFAGQLETTCLVEGATGKGLVSLNSRLLKSAVHDVVVHEGPVAETYEGLHGYRFDVTEKLGKSDPLYLRQNIHVATDERTRLVYASLSSAIRGTGFAEYLKQMDTRLDVKPAESAGSYQIRMRSRLRAERPWYAPSDVFRAKVESIALEKFSFARATILPTLANAL